MKTYKFTIEIYTYADNEAEAREGLMAELDYLMGLDNNLQAYAHPAQGEEQTEGA